MRTAVAVAAALLFAAPAPGGAAEPAAAEQLARLLMPRATWSQGIDQLSQMIEARVRAQPGAQGELPAGLAEKTRKEVEQVLPYDELVGLHAKELAAAYSPAELDGLITFYEGPLGQKTLQKMPQVSEKVALATQQRVEAKMGDVMKRLAEEARKAPSAPSKDATPPAAKGDAPNASKK